MLIVQILFAIFAKHLHQGVIDMHLAPLKNVLDRGMEETTLLLPPEVHIYNLIIFLSVSVFSLKQIPLKKKY